MMYGKSIIYQLKDDSFDRLRLGIATDETMRPSEQYVLSPFHKTYYNEIENIIDYVYDSINYYLKSSVEETMNKYNKKKKEE